MCIWKSYFCSNKLDVQETTAVSHSSTESEIISLDTGLRLDGLLALELWDLIFYVLGNVSRVSDGSGQPESDDHKHHKSHSKIDVVKDIDLVPSNVQSANREALLYVFEDNEAVIKMIIKGRSPTMRHVSRTHRVALDWLFDRINLDSKIQIKYIDTKNQLADILTKGNFTRDEWNHLLNLFNISHFSSTACTAAMAKRARQESGEERVTAKSRPMMNLTARMPSIMSSSTSSNPGRTWHGYQDPEKSVAVDDRSGKPEKTSWDAMQQVRPHHEEPLLDGNAQSVRYGEIIHDGSAQPDSVNYPEEAESETFVMGSDAAEFVNKVKDQVRKTEKNVERCRFWRRAFNNLGNEHGCGDIHGKEFHGYSKLIHEFEWNIFPGFTTLQLCGKVNDLLSNLGQTPASFTGRFLFMSMFNDISCDGKGNKEECLANARVVKVLAKKIWYWTMVIHWSRF